MKAWRVLFLALWCIFYSVALFAAVPVSVQNLRMYRAPDNTRLVFDLGASVEHQIFVLEHPDRIVIDLANARFQGNLPEVDAANPLLATIRTGRPEGTTQRFVIELKRAVKPRTFVLKPIGQYGHRLVIDLIDPQAELEEARPAPDVAVLPAPAVIPAPPVTPAPSVIPAPATPPPAMVRRRQWVIAVDAGHGGEDPGALGRQYRTREKDVTLAIARELARQINHDPEMKAVLTRDGDYFIELEQRVKRAKNHRADIFISIHADALPGRRLAYGSSVFALSEKGSNNALARAMEDQNNKSDLIGGVDLPKMPTDVQKTVIDLALDKKIEHSLLLGEDILHELERVGRVHSRQVVQTGFMVLRSKFEVQMPSVLVETAFISTPEEEKKLRSTEYQQQLAAAILKGAKKYLVRNDYSPLAPTQVVVSNTPRVAARVSSDTPREHVVKLGDTLASIARHYNVNVDALRFLNQLTSDELQVGSRLLLPRVTQGS